MSYIKFLNKKPKYSNFELERRWLLNKEAIGLIKNHRFNFIVDHYIRNSKLRLRYTEDSESREIFYKLTKKYGKQDDYSEALTTIYLSKNEYDLFSNFPHDKILKERYKIQFEDHHYAIDVFKEKLEGLLIAEIEASTINELKSIKPPPFSIKEVTLDHKYSGKYLSQIESAVLS